MEADQSQTTGSGINWNLCIVCQEPGDINVVRPTSVGFEKLLDDLKKWRLASLEPNKMTRQRIDEILSVSASLLLENKAFWHKTCRNKCDNFNLKRKANSAVQSASQPEKTPKIEEKTELGVGASFSRTTRSSIDAKKKKDCCFFCESREGELHLSATKELDVKVRKYASLANDEKLLIKLVEGDMTAIDAVYHLQCLVNLYNKVRQQTMKTSSPSPAAFDEESLAFARVVDHVKSECTKDLMNVPVFKLAELKTLYSSYLPAMETDSRSYETRTSRKASVENVIGVAQDSKSSTVHSSRFKDRLLSAIPYLSAHQQGRDVYFIADAEMGTIVHQAYEKKEDEEAYAMLKCCKDARSSVFNHETEPFDGQFSLGCQRQSVPSSLLSLVSLLLYGPKYTGPVTQETLTIAQLIKFNIKKDSRKVGNSTHRHTIASETPIAIYIAFLLHSEFRSRKLIERLHDYGLSVSYQRILNLEKGLLRAMCTQYHNNGVVCPTQLRLGIPVQCTMDNLDINPKSNTSKGSFHGTILSVLQTPTGPNMGTVRPFRAIRNDDKYNELPESYAIVPAELTKVVGQCPVNKNYKAKCAAIPDIVTQPHNEWVNVMEKYLGSNDNDCLTWRSFFKGRLKDFVDDTLPGISSILPLFHEKAASPAMVKHAMDMFIAITDFLNHGQIPVCSTDLPIYVLGKQYQWAHPEKYGENKFVWLLGGLHSEMAAWSMLGRLLTDSGWTGIISEADIATGGTSESLLKTTSLMKTRHAHTVTLMALELLQREAMKEDAVPVDKKLEWVAERTKDNPTFLFWEITKNLELMILNAVRGLREKNLDLYIDCMEYVSYYFFSLDSTNYKRWMPVHIRDMRTLPENVRPLFDNGHWVFSKTAEPFSFIPLDQANEHNVKVMKGSGGIVGLQQDPELLRNWAIVSPEVVRIINEFEMDTPLKQRKHHDAEGTTAKSNFAKEVQSAMSAICKYGNPFLLETKDLMTLDSHDCAELPEVINLQSVHSTGKKQYTEFVSNVLINGSLSIHDKIDMNSMYFFQQRKASTTRGKAKEKEMKLDFLLISKLLMACQTRNIDSKALFSHENSSYPPSLSKNGYLNLPDSKSDVLKKIEMCKTSGTVLPKYVDSHVFDGPGVMYSLKNKVCSSNTFGDLRDRIFIPWLKNQLEHCSRLDFIWDRYPPDSLKLYTREERGSGRRRCVGDGIKIPIKMEEFLKNGNNKEDLFAYLSEGVLTNMDVPETKQLHITYKDSVLSKGGDPTELAPCDHEESDTRVMLHISHAVRGGSRSLFLSTGDSDVVVIATYVFSVLVQDVPDLQLWVLFGQGKDSSVYDIRKIYEFLGPAKCRAMLFFVTFTGCDTTSQFAGKGKLSGWNAWLSYPHATNGFLIHPFENIKIDSEKFQIIERFVCILYSRTTNITLVNEMREDIFPKLEFSQLPPTREALYQHVQRSVYQCSIWLRCMDRLINAPTATLHGWKKVDERYEPLWTSLPPISAECNALLKCGCKTPPFCSNNCRCKKVWKLRCTPLCFCKGQCNAI